MLATLLIKQQQRHVFQKSNFSLKRHIYDMNRFTTAQRIKIVQLFCRKSNVYDRGVSSVENIAAVSVVWPKIQNQRFVAVPIVCALILRLPWARKDLHLHPYKFQLI